MRQKQLQNRHVQSDDKQDQCRLRLPLYDGSTRTNKIHLPASATTQI